MAWLVFRSLEEERFKIRERRSWKTYIDGLWEQKHPFFNDYQRESTKEEALHRQLGRKTEKVDISLFISLTTPMLIQWAHKWNTHGSRGHDGLPSTRPDLDIAIVKCLCININQTELLSNLPTNGTIPTRHINHCVAT